MRRGVSNPAVHAVVTEATDALRVLRQFVHVGGDVVERPVPLGFPLGVEVVHDDRVALRAGGAIGPGQGRRTAGAVAGELDGQVAAVGYDGTAQGKRGRGSGARRGGACGGERVRERAGVGVFQLRSLAVTGWAALLAGWPLAAAATTTTGALAGLIGLEAGLTVGSFETEFPLPRAGHRVAHGRGPAVHGIVDGVGFFIGGDGEPGDFGAAQRGEGLAHGLCAGLRVHLALAFHDFAVKAAVHVRVLH